MSEFAKRQLKKHGWTEGCGLGKQEDGRCEPIKVSLKMDKTGVGHDPGKDFTDHWWLRVFNEAAQQIGKKQQDSTLNEEQKKGAECKNNLYKNFVKSSTLTNGIEEKNNSSDSSSEDSSDNENYPSVPTLNDIHKFCGGATGHKAARFGIKMGGKLDRIAKHDKMFEERLEKEKLSLDVSAADSCSNNSLPDTVEQKPSLLNSGSLSDKQILSEIVGDKRKKKKHKKHKKVKCSQEIGGDFSSELTDVVSETVSKKNKTKKHKKKKFDADNDDVEDSTSELPEKNETQHHTKRKKHKNISVETEGAVCDNNLPEMNKSQKKIAEENISSDELHSEPRSKKKTEKNSSNGLLDESGSNSKKKKREKTLCSEELLDESGSKRKKKTEENISSNEFFDEPRRKRKYKKTEENKFSTALLDESRKNSKREKKTEESLFSDELLESERKGKNKKTEPNISSNELLDKPVRNSLKKIEETQQ